ncbi:phosphotransferase [Bacillus timonensis]|nr:phosphotransferase [Bacillus timonensis]
MAKKAAYLFTQNLLSIELVGGFNHNVFKVEEARRVFYIKLLQNTDDLSFYKGEIDWTLFLAQSGVRVAKPIRSLKNEYIHSIENYVVMAFEDAKGSFVEVKDLKMWNDSLFKLWGRTMGEMHKVAMQYKGTTKNVRPHWYEQPLFHQLPSVSEKMLNRLEWYMKELHQFPTDKRYYGMIHNDLHPRNFTLHNDQLTVFDFGDCEYNWYIYDIAISIYHSVDHIPRNDRKRRNEFVHLFQTAFLEGYQQVVEIEEKWVNKIGFFLNYRQLYSYLYLIRNVDIGNLTEKQRGYLSELGLEIENDIPFVDN